MAVLSVVSEQSSLGWHRVRALIRYLRGCSGCAQRASGAGCSHGGGAGVGAAPVPWDLAQHGIKFPDAWTGWVLPAFPVSVVFLRCCLPCSCPAGLKGIAGGAGLDLTPIERGKHGGGTVSAPLERVAGSASPVVLSSV